MQGIVLDHRVEEGVQGRSKIVLDMNPTVKDGGRWSMYRKESQREADYL